MSGLMLAFLWLMMACGNMLYAGIFGTPWIAVVEHSYWQGTAFLAVWLMSISQGAA